MPRTQRLSAKFRNGKPWLCSPSQRPSNLKKFYTITPCRTQPHPFLMVPSKYATASHFSKRPPIFLRGSVLISTQSVRFSSLIRSPSFSQEDRAGAWPRSLIRGVGSLCTYFFRSPWTPLEKFESQGRNLVVVPIAFSLLWKKKNVRRRKILRSSE